MFFFARFATPNKYPSVQYTGKLWNMFVYMSGIVGVEGVKPRFHDLRDSFATLALTSDTMDIATLAGILGRRDTSTTLRHYAGWVPSASDDAMAWMDEIIG